MRPAELLETLRQRVLCDVSWVDEAARHAVLGGIRLSIQTLEEYERRTALMGIGKTEAPAPASLVPASPVGVDIIGGMSREQLIQEIVHWNLISLNETATTVLLQMVVQGRTSALQQRLMREAGLISE